MFGSTSATAINSVLLDPSTNDLEGGLGQYAIGSFTAAGPQQVITFDSTGREAFLNAFQLRTAVPEPASLGLGRIDDAGPAETRTVMIRLFVNVEKCSFADTRRRNS